jgi:hypothetical protein
MMIAALRNNTIAGKSAKNNDPINMALADIAAGNSVFQKLQRQARNRQKAIAKRQGNGDQNGQPHDPAPAPPACKKPNRQK